MAAEPAARFVHHELLMISRGGRPVAGFALGSPKKTMSYEDAITANPQHIDMKAKAGVPDLTNEQLTAPMTSVASSLQGCGVPDDMKVTIRVAVKLGKAVGVTVTTDPFDAAVASCVDRLVRKLTWPSNLKLDSFTTQF